MDDNDAYTGYLNFGLIFSMLLSLCTDSREAKITRRESVMAKHRVIEAAIAFSTHKAIVYFEVLFLRQPGIFCRLRKQNNACKGNL